MSVTRILRPPAQAEYDEAADWYEAQQPGLGQDFVAEIDRVLDAIAAQPDRYPKVFGDIREAPAARFPYCVYYRVRPGRVIVLAVFHTSRDPSVWQQRS